MGLSARYLKASEAARRLGISIKALRLYEQRGLIVPIRTAAGWRAYGPEEMSRAAEVAGLRTLGFSLAQVARVLKGDSRRLGLALATHQEILEGRIRQLQATVEQVRSLRDDLARSQAPAAGDLAIPLTPASELKIAFDLPWPWGGERFELRNFRPLNYITGPLGSGKTRLAKRVAETLVGAVFLGLDRLADGGAGARARMDSDPVLKSRVDRTLGLLVKNGGTESEALLVLLAVFESEGPAVLVIDMPEQGLDRPTQEALITHLRQRGRGARPIFLLTRSSAILNLGSIGADETIIFCPANHSPPCRVALSAGAPGYEGVATCLASAEVRARTEGVIAVRPA